MIPEPDTYGSQPIRRNNNLLCVAIILFSFGVGTLQIILMIPWWSYILFFDSLTLMILLLIAIVPTLGGIYIMWKWWNSNS
ncbi:MAG: hypothetical protein ACFFCT_11975 [Candidatus Odinarchaeota archaeon]